MPRHSKRGSEPVIFQLQIQVPSVPINFHIDLGIPFPITFIGAANLIKMSSGPAITIRITNSIPVN